MIIKFTSEDVNKCKEFANNIDTGYYATRNQFNNDKRIKDQMIGKLSEIAAQKYLASVGVKVSDPDFKIYGKSKKSWDYDLKSEDSNYHVKGQGSDQSAKYGTSWIFQNTDKHIFQLYKSEDYVCFVVVDLPKLTAEIKSVIAVTDLHKLNLFKLPKLSYLTSKSAVYFSDLQKLSKIV